jgi:soluble P-type ATPase
MRTSPIVRATERVSLACQALKAAANDVVIAQGSDNVPLQDAAQELAVEIERVCELADQLERCAANVGELAGARG